MRFQAIMKAASAAAVGGGVVAMGVGVATVNPIAVAAGAITAVGAMLAGGYLMQEGHITKMIDIGRFNRQYQTASSAVSKAEKKLVLYDVASRTHALDELVKQS